MRAIHKNTVIQIEITNACHLSCANCTRHVGHHRKPFFMELDTIRKAIRSLDGFEGRIGIMGGEPTLHPKFSEICDIVQEMVPRRRREFWTAGFQWDGLKEKIHETFDKDRINYNDHVAYDGRHKPLLVALDDVVDDPELREYLIDNCPYQARWSASITPKGAFFCEIAASLDWLFDGPGGYDLDTAWWKKEPDEFRDQVDRYCGMCSGAIPLPAFSDGRGGRDGYTRDVVSISNLERLKAVGSPKVVRDVLDLWDKKITWDDVKEYGKTNPREYRSFVARSPEDVKKAITH